MKQITLYSVVLDAIVHSEESQITDIMLSVPERDVRKREGLAWGRTGLLHPDARRIVADSVTDALTATGLFHPLWRFRGANPTYGALTTSNPDIAADAARIHKYGDFFLVACYCKEDEIDGDLDIAHLEPRPYRHFRESWLRDTIISPAISSPFGRVAQGKNVSLLAEEITYAIRSHTPVTFEWEINGLRLRSSSEVHRLQVAGHPVITSRVVPCAEPQRMST